mmetsp:Transcript_1636/g.2577  ORF Transcript_1636/g.2577 Transcript_1636/m.2577 type:complete len:435 (+) Transcript_1636:102-1406(+)
MASEREFDVVVFGATGFTGALCAEYLLQTYGVNGELRWAIAGRSEAKLNKVKKSLSKLFGEEANAADLPIVVADSANEGSLRAMCARTQVVISTVGPFVNYGTPLVSACVAESTEYVDSTGESTWIRRMMDLYQEEAVAKGIRLVPSAGYDSIPSDLTVYKLVQHIKEQNSDARIKDVVNYIGPTSSSISGGTLHTIANIISAEDKKLLAKVFGNPFSLAPGGKRNNLRKGLSSQRGIKFDKTAKAWTAPWLMSSGNERIVVRSAEVNEYGSDFTYLEVTAFQSMFKALSMMLTINVGMALLLIPPIRFLITKYLFTSPGDGPSRKDRDRGIGTMTAVASSAGTTYKMECRIWGGDVGYKSTGMMLGETAAALVRSKATVGTSAGGFQTAATCAGLQDDLVDAFAEKCSITFVPSTGLGVKTMDSTYKRISYRG